MHAQIKSVASLNAMALHLMSQGLYREAQLTLRRALEELKQYARALPGVPQNENVVQVSSSKLVKDQSKHLSNQIFSSPFQVIVCDTSSQGDSIAFVSEDDVNLLSASLLFNMALAHQFHGCQAAHTKKATCFYRLALSTCQRTEIQHNAGTALLAVAIGNNLACCFADLFLYKHLETCLEWTLDTAEEMMGDYSFFWTNLVAWKNAKTLSAAAA